MALFERAAILIGAAMVVSGWAWSAGEVQAQDQVGAIAVAGAGVLLGAGAAVARTSNRWQEVARVRSAVVRELRPVLALRPASVARPDCLVRVAGGSWLHRSTCVLAQGKPMFAARRRSTAPSTCPICRPDLGAAGV